MALCKDFVETTFKRDTPVIQDDKSPINIKNELQLVSRMASLLQGEVTSIDFKENSEELFYQFVDISSVDRCAFSYNWPYVIQSTRGNGFSYHRQGGIVYFFLRKTPDHDHKYDLIIVNHLGCNSEMLVCELAEAAKTLSLYSIVKNIDEDKVAAWNSLGFKETIKPWSNYSFRDDNTFPEFVYDIDSFINLRFSRNTRSIINKFNREKHYTFVPYDYSKNDSGIALLEKMSNYLEVKGVDFKEEVFRAHQFVFDSRIKNKAAFAIFEDHNLIGITYITRFKETVFFNAVINENRSNLMRFLLWKTIAYYCNSLNPGERPLYLALQGSENAGQNNWKRFFHPIRCIRRTHITNDF